MRHTACAFLLRCRFDLLVCRLSLALPNLFLALLLLSVFIPGFSTFRRLWAALLSLLFRFLQFALLPRRVPLRFPGDTCRDVLRVVVRPAGVSGAQVATHLSPDAVTALEGGPFPGDLRHHAIVLGGDASVARPCGHVLFLVDPDSFLFLPHPLDAVLGRGPGWYVLCAGALTVGAWAGRGNSDGSTCL